MALIEYDIARSKINTLKYPGETRNQLGGGGGGGCCNTGVFNTEADVYIAFMYTRISPSSRKEIVLTTRMISAQQKRRNKSMYLAKTVLVRMI